MLRLALSGCLLVFLLGKRWLLHRHPVRTDLRLINRVLLSHELIRRVSLLHTKRRSPLATLNHHGTAVVSQGGMALAYGPVIRLPALH